jgi:phenylpropionate dioxygenase-like ring-hydroxylating dioxygenase large terminal subunit
MLSNEDNELVTRVGPGTPMGDLMRQYWVPALASTELPENDCAPVRVRILGENLIAFRTTSGGVGLIQDACMHRGASLFFGRNEEDGLRCVYHGWKYDVTGQCVDMPNEPAESNFKSRIRATAYPCVERGGVVWTYMGPRRPRQVAAGDSSATINLPGLGPVADLPPLPMIESNMQGEGQSIVGLTFRECNWLQGLEGDIDTSHLQFLHGGSTKPENTRPGSFEYYGVVDRAPRYEVVKTPGGTMYGAYRPAGEGRRYWRIAQFLFPFYTLIPTELLGRPVQTRAWVPIDDEHMMFFTMSVQPQGRAVNPRGETNVGAGAGGLRYHPNTTDRYGRFRLLQSKDNDYLVDRDLQRRDESFTGIEGIPVQDAAVTESMGPIQNRATEHLGTSDAMIVQTRRRLLDAVRALRDQGVVPPGVDEPDVYAVRSGSVFLPEAANWVEATDDLRKAFVEHPDLDAAGLSRQPA